jgi:hypothetical protein
METAMTTTNVSVTSSSRYAIGMTLVACLVGRFWLPEWASFLPGETRPDWLGLMMQFFAWWPLALLAAIGLGLWVRRLPIDSALRKGLVALQDLLTFASLALVMSSLYLVLLPR